MGDYIDRKKLKEAIREDALNSLSSYNGEVLDLCLMEIDEAPAADVAPVVHGEWILKHVGAGHYWECSSCHKNPCIYMTENTKFCPNCGAKMDGGKSDGKT